MAEDKTRSLVKSMMPGLVGAVPSVLKNVLTLERVERLFLNEFRRNPKLELCTRSSLGGAMMNIVQAGLEVGGVRQQASLVPFKNGNTNEYECVAIIGYRGLEDASYSTGEVLDIHADVVKVGDDFDYELGSNQRLVHKPKSGRTAEITHFYAYAHLKVGGFVFVVLTKEEVDHTKSRSRAKDDGPWVTDYCAMGKKTAIRRLWNVLPGKAIDRNVYEAIEKEDEALYPEMHMKQAKATVLDVDLDAMVTKSQTQKISEIPEAAPMVKSTASLESRPATAPTIPTAAPVSEESPKKSGGRPKGSKNKPRAEAPVTPEASVTPEAKKEGVPADPTQDSALTSAAEVVWGLAADQAQRESTTVKVILANVGHDVAKDPLNKCSIERLKELAVKLAAYSKEENQ
ncbi:MAG: hypothetical protein COZ56_00195 [Armatimonadetes bacterium CG_4_8_14_3_um_filter_58_9]|nr:MAG: hypothetical protein COZ56_00195 [Armatimonadetes bacterium CG_4_8_14_3_um_filter_58_9]